MARNGHSPEQVIQKLREVEILVAKGLPVTEAVRNIAATAQSD